MTTAAITPAEAVTRPSSRAHSVEWQDFSFTYPGEEHPALDRLTLRIAAGEKVLVMGPSGCGKSTLGLTLNGIIPRNTGGETSGRVLVGDIEPSNAELADIAGAVGLVFQDPDAQLCTITVEDEITFGPQNLLVAEPVIHERLARASALVGMSGHLDRDVFQLSGGQKQRVAIASSLVMQPGVIVLDEPTANLDPVGRREVLAVLSEILAAEEMTTIVIEHHPAELIELMDRVVIMKDGRVLVEGPPARVFAEHGTELAALGIRLPAATLFSLGARTATDVVPLHLHELELDAITGAGPVGFTAVAAPAASTEEVLVDFDDVWFAYGAPGARKGRRARASQSTANPVLKSLRFSVRRGEVVAIMGSNGSGKSTTSSMMIGINRATRGVVSITGEDAAPRPIADLARDVGFVFQYPEHQFVADTVYDEVAFSLRRLAHPSDIEKRVRAELERFDLAHLAEKNPFKLSLGQKRRLSIAAMSVYEPPILLLDEPTFGQDQAHTDDLVEVIREMNAGGSSVVMVTHDLRLAAQIADRAVVIDRGVAVHDGPLPGLLERLHLEGPFAGIAPLDEYTLWRDVAARRPDIAFTTDMFALGVAATGPHGGLS